ncbi:MAG TPA: hypothetical protein VH702_17105 [Vicinamibacterales bacterium]|jgi:hypothetical protein
MRSILFCCVLSLLVASGLRAPAAAQNVPSTRFEGTWVGVQRWAIDKPSPGAQEDQPVELTIENIDGKLVGTITPFFGGTDGASFVGGQIVGEELRVMGMMGKPQTTTDAATFSRNLRGGWKDNVRILFNFKTDRTELIGTADVLMDDVKWLKFKYELSRKRSRY